VIANPTNDPRTFFWTLLPNLSVYDEDVLLARNDDRAGEQEKDFIEPKVLPGRSARSTKY